MDSVGAKSPTVVGTVVELPVDDGPRVAMEVLRLLDHHARGPHDLPLREPSLDDVFLALTGKRTEIDADDDEPPPPTGDAAGAGPAAGAASTSDGGAR